MAEAWIIERKNSHGVSYVARNETMAQKDPTHWYFSNGDDRMEFESWEAANDFASACIPARMHVNLRIRETGAVHV